MIIAFNSIKGGVGKTTLAAQFIGYLSKFSKVGVLNSDSEFALETWLSRRLEANPALVDNIKLLPLDTDLSSVDLNYIVCDLAGGDNRTSRRILAEYADIVISPFKTSQFDIDTVIKHSNILKEVKEFNPGIKSYYLFNLCDTNPKNKEFAESMQIFSQLVNQNIIISELIEYPIFNRIVLRSSAADGLSCFDLGYKAKKSKAEIENVIKSILNLKGKK